ncbi:M14 metallopeptidase family protein [Paraglaciecola arctica]|uniref:Peptidase M14, carboxypeptidase A n=1 Tax=Paraglaciecola arctica BSs20135 TaxID=493475 RepID=K6Y1Z3_9ALTE|nr:M14 metallopeptidase family protein [Paraglaciecola arctica]GAC17951.1 peptidase M14, carboxypeptidase A [Paraglaciecola arctica BSs20135]
MDLMFRIFVFCLLFSSAQVAAVIDTAYLPADTQYKAEITTPTQALGAPVGEWHVRHDQIANYMQVLASQSDRVSLVETGRTHENRPLYLLAFSSAENQRNLAAIQARHIKNLGQSIDKNDPLIIWMGYSVHGNEPSGANAALLIAYYLAAGESEVIDELLKDNIVLLDPSVNPDGLSRFAQWANMHKSKNLVSDPNNREHQEAWPSGRTNHYWFDLNRDWLLLTHPESRARINQFHQWRPHVLTDFHEMGTNSTYFFQPGISSRKNPWTPLKNVELTTALGDFHAAALDKTKQLYFTQESFDDFYYGKGSTYPDAHGSIGILFEQASSRGHLQDSDHGTLKFSDTIQNQITTSLSTFAGALANKQAILDYQLEFAEQTKSLVKKDDLAGYILNEKFDQYRFSKMLEILSAHQIQYFPLSKDVKVEGQTFDTTNSMFVPLDQPQYRLIKSLFSTRKSFDDNTFYDVSNWNLPLAFNIQYQAVERHPKIDKQPTKKSTSVNPKLLPGAYAYAFSWENYQAPKLLLRLLANKVKVKLAGDAFFAQTSQGGTSFSAGSVIVPIALEQPDNLLDIIDAQNMGLDIAIHSVTSGLTRQGIDLGSRKMLNITQPKVLLVGGRGTSQYEVGEVWHYLDQHVDMPVSITDLELLSKLSLDNYTHMIWVEGRYKEVSDKTVKKIGDWLNNGGILIGQKTAANWFSNKNWLKASFKSDSEVKLAFETTGMTYKDQEALRAKQRIAGAVFETQLDLSHPLAFGYTSTTLPMFRNSALVMRQPDKPFITAASYVKSPLMGGYTADEFQQLISGSAAIVSHNVGKGKVIGFASNVNFRGVWYGTSRLMSNAIFMAGFINAPG